jgi:restriction endonuclease S subunit
MTKFTEVAIGELFEGKNGHPRFITTYIEEHPGPYPVYSASLLSPFGSIATFDFEGTYLTWVMNGYGGRVQEIAGRFSANRDRGVFLPREKVRIPDLTYLRHIMEPALVSAAVGRRVDGRANDYTKIYPNDAEEVVISLPITSKGHLDYERMESIGARLRRIETAQDAVARARDPLARATFAITIPEPTDTLQLADDRYFELSIGDRVLRSQHTDYGVPVFSANARVPFGRVKSSNLEDFSRPSILWGIDGIFDWNFIPAGEPFATTDHCGRLVVIDDRIDPLYVYAYLRATRDLHGFDRVFRASLKNMREEVSVVVPLDKRGIPSLRRQRDVARQIEERASARESALASLDDVLRARLTLTT